ncbi:MAG: hypothetical protein ACK2U3_08025 [Anaerolineales bacterium]|jgi:hypothetical protein
MRIDHEILTRLTQELIEERVARDRSVISVYLCGSLLEENYLLGGTTDVDLVFIHYDEVKVEREVLPITEDVHFDIAHHHQNLYRTPRSLRVHPWWGPTIKECKILHDPQHFMDFTQASVRGQFERPDRVFERAHSQIVTARKIWVQYQAEEPDPGPEQLLDYFKALKNAVNAISGFNGPPLTDRRLLIKFPERAEKMGKPGMAAGLLGMLGAPNITEDVYPELITNWNTCYEALHAESMPVRLHPIRKDYYYKAFEAMVEGGERSAMLWPLLRTWTLAASDQTANSEIRGGWQTALGKMKLLGEDFRERLAGLDAYLDLIEGTIEDWAHKNGVWVE